jgi:hypothetical protein
VKLGSKILLGVGAALVVIQFVRPSRNESAGPFLNDITAHYETPEAVRTILQNSCYDCHSNHTRYPWYYSIQPVAWWMNHHIEEARHHLDFNEFATYTAKRQNRAIRGARREIEKHDMPIESYLLIHHDARLTDEQIKLVSDWTKTVEAKIGPVPAK